MISNESNSHEVELEDNEIINDFTNSKNDENVEVEKLKNDTGNHQNFLYLKIQFI